MAWTRISTWVFVSADPFRACGRRTFRVAEWMHAVESTRITRSD